MILSNQPQLLDKKLIIPVKTWEERALVKMFERHHGRLENDVRPARNLRSVQFNRYYWGVLVQRPVDYCNQRYWLKRPLWIVNGVAVEITERDVHNFHLGFLSRQERVYGALGNQPVYEFRSTTKLVHASKFRQLEDHEVDTETFMLAIIEAWAKLSEGELLLPKPNEVDVNTYDGILSER